MKCLNEGSIQAYIDRELNDIQIKEIEMHLCKCQKCTAIYNELNSVNDFAMVKLQNYKKEFNINELKAENLNLEIKNKKGVFKDMKKYRNMMVAACAAIVLTTCITVKPIKAAIVDAVSIFRVKDIKTVNISVDDLKQLETALQNHKSNIDIDKVGKVSFKGGDHKTSNIEDAKKTLPFSLLIPDNMLDKDTQITVADPSRVDFTLDVENMNTLLKSLGGKNVFPKNLDGKTFSLDMSGEFNINYKYGSDNKHVYINESKIPELLAPSEANVDEIFNALSELSVLPEEMQHQLKSMKDWKSTLYIPNIGITPEELNINGMKAIGYFENTDKVKHSSILILKDNILISISGNVDKNELIEIAKSMR
jgi:hypothetical protein